MSSGFSSQTLSQVNKRRLIVLVVLIFSIIILYILHLFKIQVVEGYEYRKRAQAVSRKAEIIPSQRGKIYDRHRNKPLVTNTDSFALSVIPAEVPRNQFIELFNRLSEVLDVDSQIFHDKVPAQYYHLYQPIELVSSISLEKIGKIAETLDLYPGIVWNSKPIRKYNAEGSISHILGYVGNITREELQVLYNQGYDFGTVLGKTGIEKYYDKRLRGTDGRRFRTVDVRGRSIKSAEDHIIASPQLGEDIVLTIDAEIQSLAEKALGEHIGSAVVLKPATGEILAMVSYPWYNPDVFYKDNSGQIFRDLSLDSRFPFLNRAIQSSYAPASCFKIIMSTAILEEEAFPEDETVTCHGYIRVGDRRFLCHRRSGHGPLDLPHAFAESCNVYYYTVGRNHLGINRISEYANSFGLGKRTGIDLPGEVDGNVPTPEWKEQVYHSPWVGGDTINTSIGQGFLAVTPLQMANIIAMIVNEGVIYKPHLLKEIRDPVSGHIIESVNPEILHQVDYDKEVFEKVQKYMRMVVTEGSARYVITTKETEVAGKTGTGEVGIQDHFHSWFVSYAPYNAEPEDQVVVVVMTEAVNDWDWWAPKAVDMIMHGIFADQSYEEVLETLRPWYLRW